MNSCAAALRRTRADFSSSSRRDDVRASANHRCSVRGLATAAAAIRGAGKLAGLVGERLQCVIVADTEHALRLLGELARQRQGRAPRRRGQADGAGTARQGDPRSDPYHPGRYGLCGFCRSAQPAVYRV